MVLTSHIEGKGGPCQGPAPKQPQNQQGGKAGNQGLTGPQARGQHQGAHKHSPAAKPGGKQGTHVDSIRRTQGGLSEQEGRGSTSPVTARAQEDTAQQPAQEVVHLLQG